MANRYQAKFVLIFILLLVSVQGCSQKSNQLEGTEWQLVSLNGKNLIANTTITIYFIDDFLGGQMDCNKYGGTQDTGKYDAKSDGTFSLGSLFAVTVQLCTKPEGIMEQEAAYIEALQDATHFSVIGDQLEMEDEAGETILVFQK